jgi:DNA-binding transcriptional LysR family regulator
MAEFDDRQFEHWCREVTPELATFYAACKYKTRAMAGKKLGKDGQNVGRSITRLDGLLNDLLSGASLVSSEEPRKVIPTDAGKALLRYCEESSAAHLRLVDNLTQLQRSSEIRAATTHYAWLAYGDGLVRAYKQRRPDGVVNFGGKFYGQDRVWDEIEREVLEGRADIGVYSFPPSRQRLFPKDLSLLNWIEEEIVLVLPRELAKKVKGSNISIYELSLLLPALPPVVHYSRSLGFDRTDTIEDYLRSHRVLKRFEGDWLLGVNSIAEIKDTLKQKGGISFLPWPTVAEDHKKGTLTAYRLNAPMRARVIKIISRLHNSRGAVQDFIAAATTLRDPKNLLNNPRPQR